MVGFNCLIGGEETWQDIDEAIRQRTAVVILVLSREGVKKQGLRNELAIADAVARKRGRAEFLLPVKIDDLPFDEVPPKLMPKNIIEFSSGWAAGLERVLKALERDSVPRATRAATARVSGFGSIVWIIFPPSAGRRRGGVKSWVGP